jgi:hypothetical protein
VPGAISSATLCANSGLNRNRDASFSASTPTHGDDILGPQGFKITGITPLCR